MILKRAAESVTLLKSTGEFDEYGTKPDYEEYGSADMYITLYTQSRTEDARYKDVTHIGYTDSKDISDDMAVRAADGAEYKVSLVNAHARHAVVYLERTEL